MKWARHPALTVAPTTLDVLVAVFHPASGETHLLESRSARLLDCLGDGPATVQTLAGGSDEPAEHVAARLLDLLDTGLIVPA